MGKGLVKPSIIGMSQGDPLSPILSNVNLDKFNKEPEKKGFTFQDTEAIVTFLLKAR